MTRSRFSVIWYPVFARDSRYISIFDFRFVKSDSSRCERELSGTIFVRWPQKLSGTVVGNYPAPGKRARFRFASGLLLACFRNASRMLQAADPKQILSRS